MIEVHLLAVQCRGEPIFRWEMDGQCELVEYDIPTEARRYLNFDDSFPVLDLRDAYDPIINDFVKHHQMTTKLKIASFENHRGWWLSLRLVFDKDEEGIYFKMWFASDPDSVE